MDRFDVNKFIAPVDPKNPRYQSSADFNTNAPSYYQELARKQELVELLAKRVWEYDQLLAEKLEEVRQTMQQYADLLDGKIEDFDRIILEKTEAWLSANMEGIMNEAVQLVWFGLTDDGHFMAVSPPNWKDVQFDTTNDGQLMLIN